MVGCINVEDAATTDKETDSKVVATENSDTKSEKEEAVAEVVGEPERKNHHHRLQGYHIPETLQHLLHFLIQYHFVFLELV